MSDAKPDIKYHCNYCDDDITQQVRVRCVECVDFDLCTECFSLGAEMHSHKATHAYRLLKGYLRYEVLEPGWTADEEILLLDGIRLFGLGCWDEISQFVDTKTPRQCEVHYLTAYLNEPTPPEPIAMDVDAATSASSGKRSRSRGTSSASTLTGISRLVGARPRRFEFDLEHEDDAEALVMDMGISTDDDEETRAKKMRLLQVYNTVLDERQQRKEFVLSRDLLHAPRSRFTEEEEIRAESDARPLARFHSAEEHEAFVNGLVTELRLRKRLQQLLSWQGLGVQTLAGGARLERAVQAAMATCQAPSINGTAVAVAPDAVIDQNVMNVAALPNVLVPEPTVASDSKEAPSSADFKAAFLAALQSADLTSDRQHGPSPFRRGRGGRSRGRSPGMGQGRGATPRRESGVPASPGAHRDMDNGVAGSAERSSARSKRLVTSPGTRVTRHSALINAMVDAAVASLTPPPLLTPEPMAVTDDAVLPVVDQATSSAASASAYAAGDESTEPEAFSSKGNASAIDPQLCAELGLSEVGLSALKRMLAREFGSRLLRHDAGAAVDVTVDVFKSPHSLDLIATAVSQDAAVASPAVAADTSSLRTEAQRK